MAKLGRLRKETVKRALLLMAVVTLCFLIFAGRVFYISTGKEVNGQDLQALAESRWTTTQTLPGERGTIYTREGQQLAKEVQAYTAFAILDEDYDGHVEDPKVTAEKLAPYIDMEESRLAELLQRDQFQVELGPGSKYLTLSQKQEIEALELPGIYFRTEKKRYYPKQVFASHVLGYTARDMSEAVMGLEASLDKRLSAKDGSLTYQRNVKGIPLLNKEEILREPKNGEDVYLTIDTNIQIALEQAMTAVDEEYKPQKMTAIVANAETGEILAMGNRPSFNPNDYSSITNYTNYAVSDRFEPGSTMKMFTLAAAIDAGVYNEHETYESGTYTIGDSTIGDHNNSRGWGTISFDEGLVRSSNVAFAKLALEKLKPERFYEYLQAFGFREKTGIDLPNEADSLVAHSSKLDAAVTAFGQGTAVTPIQMVQAATAIANDGKMMKPYIIDKMYDLNENKQTYEAVPEAAGEPIKKETAVKVREKLEQVVTGEHGTGHPYQIEGINVAGKTGTAQISNPNGKGYLSGYNQNIFSFLGMAPAEDPKVIVYVAVDRPQLPGHETGSAPVSKIFNPVMKQSLSYMNLSTGDAKTEKVYEEDGIQLDSFENKHVKKAVKSVKELGLKPVVIGDGSTITEQYPLAGSSLIIGEKVFLLTSGKLQMPDMAGWSLRDAKRFSVLVGLQLHHLGSGYVTEQSIDPGAVLQENDYLTVELKDPDQIRKEQEETKKEEDSHEEKKERNNEPHE